MKKIGLFYGSTDGTTHKVAQKVRAHWEEKIVLHDVSMGRKEEIQQYDILILATSTWDVGKL
ncbi:MAG: flavodoxin, partial [Bacteroidetes bacterium]|nr:flavodoxin [Bacteroidota bacterium]